MKTSIIKYDLWNALSTCAEEYKTDEIKKLIKQLSDTMSIDYRVTIEVTK